MEQIIDHLQPYEDYFIIFVSTMFVVVISNIFDVDLLSL